MRRVKLIFYGTDRSDTTETELSAHTNAYNEICISIVSKDGLYDSISLDKSTAIKFSKELRKQIALIVEK